MDRITDFFLRAERWLIVVLFVGTYLVGDLIITVLLVPRSRVSITSWRIGALAELAILPFVLCFMGWLLSVGSFLHSIVKPEPKLNIVFFYLALGYATIYLLMAMPFFVYSNAVESVILPITLFAMFCLGYTCYFVSKSLSMKNKGRSVVFGDYGLNFILLLAFPVGQWLIQPRINQLYAERKS